jgi:hypothetical protein
MKGGVDAVALASARFMTPAIALFALALLARDAPGDGVGALAGLAFALLIAVHALVYGARAARTALPPAAARLLFAAGIAGVFGADLTARSAQVAEAGLFLIGAAGASLVLFVLIARAPTLRDAE